jgi:hypothetical protein
MTAVSRESELSPIASPPAVAVEMMDIPACIDRRPKLKKRA